MLKRFVTIIIVTLFVSGTIFAQLKPVSKIILDDSKTLDGNFTTSTVVLDKLLVGEVAGTTNYDSFTNSIVRDQIVFFNGKPHLTPMVRPWAGVTARRTIAHLTKNDAGTWTSSAIYPVTANTGWPQVDVQRTGELAGTMGVVAHTPNRLAILNDDGSFTVNDPFESTTDPSFQFMGSNIFLAASGNRIQFQFYKTEDYGVNYTNWDSISTHSPLPTYWVENGGVEVGMSKSADEMHLAYFGTNDALAGDGGQHYFDGISEDSCDNIWLYSTPDAGTTWSMTRVAVDGVPGLVPTYHTPRFAPLFENFGQIDLAIANNGVKHMIANGYGAALSEDLTSVVGFEYPVLYWNSSAKTWKSISSIAIDTIEISDYRPGNGIGQSYPSISVSDDGMVLYALWTGPQITDGHVDFQAIHDTSFFWRDIYHSFSTDGGLTWTAPAVLPGAGEKNVAETFAHASQHLEKVGNTYVAHIMYLRDLNASADIFETAPILTDNPIVYDTFIITVTDVNENTMVNSFELSQNYPNPFNPTTSIKYSIGERSNVSIKVFDLLGKEVASLVNDVKDAGSHEVTFDASKLASGMYIYKINAGNFSSSKKMMLMK